MPAQNSAASRATKGVRPARRKRVTDPAKKPLGKPPPTVTGKHADLWNHVRKTLPHLKLADSLAVEQYVRLALDDDADMNAAYINALRSFLKDLGAFPASRAAIADLAPPDSEGKPGDEFL